MPGLLFHPIGRREFLKVSSQALIAGAVSSVVASGSAAEAASQRVHLALLSDTHVAADPKNEHRKFLPAENLQQVAAQVAAARPQAALIDGDAARLAGEPGDYEALKGLLEPIAQACPVYIGLGNHDHRENFLKVFPAVEAVTQKVPNRHVVALEYPFVRVLLLDSLLYVNQVAGLLGKAQREWLDRYLATEDGRPTVLFVHHTLGDNDGELLDVDALFRIVKPYKKVKAIFYGHSHQYNYREQQGLHLVNLPAIGYNFNDREPVGWVDAHFSARGVDLTLRACGGNRELDGVTTSLIWHNL